MIHRYLCDPQNTKNYSGLRMQFHFLISRYVCEDGFIPLTYQEIAELLSCDIQSVYKFIKQSSQEGIIEVIGKNLYLKKHVNKENFKEIGYIAHLPFIESSAYRSLGLQTQRFALYALWSGVHKGKVLVREVSKLYHTHGERNGALNLYTKEAAELVLEEASLIFHVERFKKAGKEWFKVTSLRTEFQEKSLWNQGENKWLEDRLLKYYCDTILSDETKKNILQLKSEYIRKLGSIGLELVERALETLLFSFSLYDQEQRREVGKVFRGILNKLAVKLVPTIRTRIVNTQRALKEASQHISAKATTWIQNFTNRLSDLEFAYTQLKEMFSSKDEQKPIAFPFYNWLETN
jgi:hypothetical protein